MSGPDRTDIPPVAVTMGEPAGIGGELLLKLWRARHQGGGPGFVAFADPTWLRGCADLIGEDVPLHEISDPRAGPGCFAAALPVIPVPLAVSPTPGRPDPANAGAVISSIRHAVAAVQGGSASAILTSPIHKAVLIQAGFAHPGHTEFLAELAGGTPVAMLLAVPGLKVVPVTIHLPLAQVAPRLTGRMIFEQGRILAEGLQRWWGIAAPRLAVCGLNPHAGEDGALGDEESRIIAPAIAALRAAGLDATGPWPADSLFHAEARAGFDAALCMYHDQALIPLKTIDFWNGINVTLGLPFLRTSPDHGTALGIAGRGVADPRSTLAAYDFAARLR